MVMSEFRHMTTSFNYWHVWESIFHCIYTLPRLMFAVQGIITTYSLALKVNVLIENH